MATILCIEDEEPLRRLISGEIEFAGYRVLTAENGRRGLEVIRAEKPDLILCDILMPDMDGYELLTELRLYHPEFAWTPFIFLTALTDSRDVVKGKALGADDYLTKPVDFDLLLGTVEARIARLEALRNTQDLEMVGLYSDLTGVVFAEDILAGGDGLTSGRVGVDREPDQLPTTRAPQEAGEPPLLIACAADQDLLDSLEQQAQAAGFQFKCFTSGQRAIKQVPALKPAGVVISFRTGDLAGQLVGEALGALIPVVPKLFVTPPELKADVDAARLPGIFDTLVLPGQEDRLQDYLARWRDSA